MTDTIQRTTVLVADDSDANRRLLERMLTDAGYAVATAADGEAALTEVAQRNPDVILLDVLMPKIDGYAVCRRLKSDPATRLIPVVMMTGGFNRRNLIRGMEAGADEFLGKPLDRLELLARVRSLARLKHYTDDLDSAESVLLTLAHTVEARDPYTQGHCERLARYAQSLGRMVGLGQTDLDTLRRGGVLHDIGKIAIPDAVLFKPGQLTPEEVVLMQQHTAIGEGLCGSLRSLRAVRPIVRHHHERFDGSGYPDGLRGDAIPLLAQIVGIVDVFDALTTARSYKQALSKATAFEELEREVRRGWRRPDLTEAFIALQVNGVSDLTIRPGAG